MQERMRKLVDESTRKKKTKKKAKEKVKKPTVNSTGIGGGKPSAHGALTKANNAVTSDSVDDSIASVVSGHDLNVTPKGVHHPAPSGGKSMNTMHNTINATANATVKAPKSKGNVIF